MPPKDDPRSEREKVTMIALKQLNGDHNTNSKLVCAIWDAALDAAAERITDAIARQYSCSKTLHDILQKEFAALKGDRNVEQSGM